MAFWSKKDIIYIIKSGFSSKGIEFNVENDTLTFAITFNEGFVIHPYIKIDTLLDEISIIINIRKGESKSLNDFNKKSRYFKAVSNDGITYLSYVAFVSNDNAVNIIDNALSSLAGIADLIRNL